MDASIIRATTPTLKYTFRTVDPSAISVAYLTIKRGSYPVIEKDLSAATVGANFLSWTLTQAETLGLQGDRVVVQLNWKTNSGVRGASKQSTILILPNSKAEVI